MKKNIIVSILLFLLPVAAIIILFIINPLAGIAGILALLGYSAYVNLPAIYSFLGKAAYSKGDLVKATAKFEKAYKTGRAKPMIIVSYGYILLKLGNIEEAYTILNKMVE